MLLVGKDSIKKTYYEILSVKEDASCEEIRASYRAAILNSHPDKMQGKSKTNSQPELQERFLQVQKAWEILGDSKSRAVYDNELQASRWDTESGEDVRLEEMMVNDTGEVLEFLYQCRCRDYFLINSEELGEIGFSFEEKEREDLRALGRFSFEEKEREDLRALGRTPASVVLSCGSCSLKIRLVLDSDL